MGLRTFLAATLIGTTLVMGCAEVHHHGLLRREFDREKDVVERKVFSNDERIKIYHIHDIHVNSYAREDKLSILNASWSRLIYEYQVFKYIRKKGKGVVVIEGEPFTLIPINNDDLLVDEVYALKKKIMEISVDAPFISLSAQLSADDLNLFSEILLTYYGTPLLSYPDYIVLGSENGFVNLMIDQRCSVNREDEVCDFLITTLREAMVASIVRMFVEQGFKAENYFIIYGGAHDFSDDFEDLPVTFYEVTFPRYEADWWDHLCDTIEE